MGYEAFKILLNENLLQYLLILFATGILYYFILKNFYTSIIDPFIFSQIFSLFATSVVFFLYAQSQISFFFFSNFILTQLAFWIGIRIYKPVNEKTLIMNTLTLSKNKVNNLYIYIFFIFSAGTYTATILLTYRYAGIPLFMQSRLETYSSGGGIGILGRLSTIFLPISIYLSYYILFNNKALEKFFVILYLFFVTITLIFSGSKSALLTLIFILYIYVICQEGKKTWLKIKNNQKTFLIIASILAFAMFYKNYGNQMITGFVERMIASGDVFYFAYPNDVIDKLSNHSAFKILFSDFLGTFRIFYREELPKALGFQLFEYHYGVDLYIGPNGRHNVFGYYAFGYVGSIFFSFIIGVILSYVRNKYYTIYARRNMSYNLLFLLMYIGICSIETDPFISIVFLNNSIIVIFILLIFFILFLSSMQLSKKISTKNTERI